MSESIGGIHYELDLEDTQFKTKVKKASGSMESLKDSFKKAEEGSKLLLGAMTAAVAGVIAFGVQSVNAFNEANRAEAKLIQLHKENTGATDEQVKMLIRQTDELQRMGVVEGDAIKNGQAQLATFKLSTGAILKLTPAMTDMVAHMKGANATGEDFVTVGNLIGKVMEGNVGALGRYGVSLTENQEKELMSGSMAKRSAILADVLAQNYGGVNKALMATPEGKLASIKNKFGDIQESLGGVISEGIAPFLDAINYQMDVLLEDGTVWDQIKMRIEENKEALMIITGAILVGLIPALASLAVSIWAVIAPLLPFLAIGAALGLIVFKISEQFGGFNNMMLAVKLSLQAIWNIIGPILLPALNQLYQAFVNELLPALISFWNFISPVLIPVLTFLAKLIGGVLFVAVMAIVNAFTIVIKIVSTFINLWISLIQNIKEKGIKGIVDWFRALPAEIGKMLSGIAKAILAPFDGAFEKLKAKLTEIKNKIADALNPYIRHSPSLVDWIHRGANEMENTYSDMFSKLGAIADQNRMGLVGAVKSIGGGSGMANRGGGTSGTTINNISINPKGIFARTPGEIRDIAGSIMDEVKKIGQAQGQQVKIIT